MTARTAHTPAHHYQPNGAAIPCRAGLDLRVHFRRSHGVPLSLFNSWSIGGGALRHCYNSPSYARRLLEDRVLQFKMPTVSLFLRMLGPPLRPACWLHTIMAFGAIDVLWGLAVLRRRGDSRRGADGRGASPGTPAHAGVRACVARLPDILGLACPWSDEGWVAASGDCGADRKLAAASSDGLRSQCAPSTARTVGFGSVALGSGAEGAWRLTRRKHRPTRRAAFRQRLIPSDLPKGEIEGMVGARGFEPPTPCSRSRCATRLRYAPTIG